MLTEQQKNVVSYAIEKGANIVISGMIASGKSTLYSELMAACAISNHHYTLIDEVVSKADVSFVNRWLEHHTTSPIMFTTRSINTDIIKKFPSFNGVIIHTMHQGGDFSAELIGVM